MGRLAWDVSRGTSRVGRLNVSYRQLISNLNKHTVVPGNFSQKDNGMWIPDHYPCLAPGLLF